MKTHPFSKHKIITFSMWALAMAAFLLMIIFVSYTVTIFTSSGLSAKYIINTVNAGLSLRKQFEDNKITFLIFGLDERNDILESTVLTDTILLASLDTKNNTVTLLPIPRDLWISELQTKVNALYYYGQVKNPDDGALFAKNELEKITGMPIDYYLVMNYDQLPALIDTLGGVAISIDESFTDARYPNPDFIDGTATEAFTTVQFEKGEQILDGKQALSFVRSRNSEGDTGGDQSRNIRQMAVFSSLVDRLSKRSLALQPETLGKLYRFWHDGVKTNVSDETIIGLILATKPSKLTIQQRTIPIQESDTMQPILSTPPKSKYGVWVYEPKDTSWQQFQTFVQETFN